VQLPFRSFRKNLATRRCELTDTATAKETPAMRKPNEILPRIFGIGFLLSLLAVAAPSHAACTLAYYGGPVLSNPEVVEVYWTDQVRADLQTFLPTFYGAIVDSSYLDWLAEYQTRGHTGGSDQFIGRGTFKGTVTITPSTTSKTLNDAQISAELVAQINAGNLPRPSTDAAGNVNTFYSVDFPLGYTMTVGGSSTSCQQFCYSYLTLPFEGKRVPFGIVPDLGAGSPCAGGCGTAANYLDNESYIHSALFLNVITDPQVADATAVANPIGWYGSGSQCGNIADICQGQTATVAGYTVCKGWSNKSAACVVSETAIPICTGTGATTPAACRGCTVADDAVSCTGATPRCDTAPASTTYGQCVAAPVDAGVDAAGSTDAAADAAGSTDASTDAAGPADAGGSTDTGSSTDASASSDSPAPTGNVCVPGQQIACACVGGSLGAQACLPTGTGYAACECPDAAPSNAAGSTPSSGCGCRIGQRAPGSWVVTLLALGGFALVRRSRRGRSTTSARAERL
jgi:MYXO-CTERM domain-containing protein